MDAGPAVRRLKAPVLFVVARLDSYVVDTRAMYRAAASKDKQLVVRPGGRAGASTRLRLSASPLTAFSAVAGAATSGGLSPGRGWSGRGCLSGN
jgi:hypothetical protein